jgi:proteic killer suppression protein
MTQKILLPGVFIFAILKPAVAEVHSRAPAATLPVLMELSVPPGNRLERLKGNRANQYSIRINQQYRISVLHDLSFRADFCKCLHSGEMAARNLVLLQIVNYWICFVWEEGHAYEVEITDSH